MKRLLSFILIIIVLGSCDSNKKTINDSVEREGEVWGKEEITKHLANREDSLTWDWSMFKNDLEYIDMRKTLKLPMTNGVFPVPEYNIIKKESFKGVGNYACLGGDCEKRIESKTILYNSFFARKNKFNEEFVKDRENEIFFHIVVLMDEIDTINYSHHSGEVVSRNHPDYICQGFFNIKNDRIDYNAFLTANRNSYAIINMRLFDLKYGKTLLIAPQKDRSVRSMQIKSPSLSSQEIDKYTDELLKEKSVINFFTSKESI